MFYEDNHIKIYNKDCRFMSELPDESVQCVVTSPPYWGLRKYSGEQELIWGGEPTCEHQWEAEVVVPRQSNPDTGLANTGTGAPSTRLPGLQQAGERSQSGGHFCSLCGAWKGAYGLEPTPEMYIQHTIEILREIRRVLRKDGVVFWNIGDSYAQARGHGHWETREGKGDEQAQKITQRWAKVGAEDLGLKPKDLCLIPFRVAIVAQEDGWWVRSVIIWSKPNPMPESVRDRPTESHEYILMLTKSKRYYWDADAVREPLSPLTLADSRNASGRHTYGDSKWEEADKPSWYRAKTFVNPEAGRNIRSVWEFPTQPYPEAHFAVFPEKLPELCIKAATPEVGCCSKCGAPYKRITKPSGEYAKYLRPHREHLINKEQLGEYLVKARNTVGLTQDELCAELGINSKGHGGMVNHFENGRAIPTPEQWVILKRVLCLDTTWDSPILEFSTQEKEYHWEKDITTHHHLSVTLNAEYQTLGWRPTCSHKDAPKVSSIVLDPFLGAGTTLWVAKKLNRRAVGYEISKEYCQLAVDRCQQQVLL